MSDASPIHLPVGGAPTFEEGDLLFIGTATVLIRCAGFTILTDPNFLHQGEHAKLGYGLRSKRRTEPAMTAAQLPALDFVVLSHHHGDHFDDVAARQLDKGVPILTTPHAAGKLLRQGFRNPRPLRTWESQLVVRGEAQVRVTSMPGRHGPGLVDAVLPPVMGSLLEFSRGEEVVFRLYVTGDTLLHDRLSEIPVRHPDIDLALLHLGGTRVLGVLVTMDATQGIELLRLVEPREAVPIHYNDYTVFKEPLEVFERAADRAALPTEVRYLAHGERHQFRVGRRSS